MRKLRLRYFKSHLSLHCVGVAEPEMKPTEGQQNNKSLKSPTFVEETWSAGHVYVCLAVRVRLISASFQTQLEAL